MTALLRRSPLEATASLDATAALHRHRDATLAALRDSPVESRAAIGSDATLDMMTNRPVLVVHSDQSVTLQEFVPAETTHYICRP
jgi:hypothetical protein